MTSTKRSPSSREPRVLLDVDGVVADFVTSAKAAATAVTGKEYWGVPVTKFEALESLGLTKSQVKAAYEVMNSPNYAYEMSVIPGAPRAVKKLVNVADVYFVTAPLPTSPTWDYDRRRWLKKVFGTGWDERVVFTKEKHLIAGDFFVDDKIENVEEWQSYWHSGKAILLSQPWNLNDSLRDAGIARLGNLEIVYEFIHRCRPPPLQQTFVGRRVPIDQEHLSGPLGGGALGPLGGGHRWPVCSKQS